MKQNQYSINKMASQWFVILFCITSSTNCYAQYNLVPNYSFEDSAICPSADTDLLPRPWYKPTIVAYQNGNYLNSCSIMWYASVPYNSDGYQYAHSGQAYAAIETFKNITYNTARFYLQTKLKDSLKIGKRYYAEFYASTSDIVAYGSNNVSMLFTKKAVYVDTLVDPNGVIAGNAQIYNYGNPIIFDTMNWVKVSGIFKAQGGERFITIGNFKNGNQTNSKLINNTTYQCDCAGYFIDDVSVVPLDSMPLKADAGRDTTIHIGDSAFIGSLTNGLDSLHWVVQGTTNKIDSTRPGFWVHPTVNTCYVVTQTVNGFTSSDTVCVIVQTVPLKFINFQVQLQPTPNPSKEGNVRLDWTTANEINVSHFYVQRSTPELSGGKDFTIIHKEQADNQTLNNYSFTDEAPNAGVNYYRIVSIDRDGKTSFSEVREITISKEQLAISIYPNPAKDVVNIECKEGIKEVMIFNAVGQQISRQEPRNDAITINIKNFNKGLYIVRVITKAGEVKTEKLIVE